ncbi:Ig-like V-type domain-containing protein FAM187A [Echinops telfairi]|uniref:Ig-like V-type domain-containing protein FAM187A n=1 Tax=Echinops telfairi TaxID=9371 RepID=A0ABM0ITU4_ECHTE|nr:Ig-like V-type domain-containing protein FAM187A [Echinops telfairi]
MSLAHATVLLWAWGSLLTFEIVEKENIFQKTPCPAFLMFDNAAYLTDMSFELPCHCKPEEVLAVVWYHQKHLGSTHTQVLTDFDGRVLTEAAAHVRVGSDMLARFSIRMFSLLVFRAQPEDSGLYFCGTRKGDYFYAYDVDIQSSEGMVASFRDEGQEPFEDEYHGDLRVFTTFWEWTPCDRCGVRGEQWRIGLCYLQSPDLSPRYRQTLPNAVSCGSQAVPRKLRARAKHHTPELLVRSCLVSCERRQTVHLGLLAIFNYVSKAGRRPWVPQVPIQFHQQMLGHGLLISCPGARPEHAVAWDKDRQQLYRTQYLKDVNRSMRVFIDHGNQLHIRFTQLSDRGIYYCWRQGVRVAGFRLAVKTRGHYHASFSDPETRAVLQLILLGYALITATFATVHLCRCCCYFFRCCPNLSP